MIAQGALKDSGYAGACIDRISRTSNPTRQEPTTSASAPPFGSCRVGFEVRDILPGSTIEGRYEVPPID